MLVAHMGLTTAGTIGAAWPDRWTRRSPGDGDCRCGPRSARTSSSSATAAPSTSRRRGRRAEVACPASPGSSARRASSAFRRNVPSGARWRSFKKLKLASSGLQAAGIRVLGFGIPEIEEGRIARKKPLVPGGWDRGFLFGLEKTGGVFYGSGLIHHVRRDLHEGKTGSALRKTRR